MDGFKLLGFIFMGVVDDVGVTIVWVEGGLNGGWFGWGVVEVWGGVVRRVGRWWCGVIGECLFEYGCDGIGVHQIVFVIDGGRL